jgi:hypothetical protein
VNVLEAMYGSSREQRIVVGKLKLHLDALHVLLAVIANVHLL